MLLKKNHNALEGYEVLTLFINTDGATPFRSVKKTFRPFWALIDNLPTPQRTAFSNMLLVALWKGKSKHDFSVVGLLIGKELKAITSGVYSNKLSKHFRVEIKDYICDMVANAPSLNVVQFNSYFGCVYCDMKGVHENHRHLYSCNESFHVRSVAEFRKDAAFHVRSVAEFRKDAD